VLSGGSRIAGWRRGTGKAWTVELPEVKDGKRYVHQLFINANRRERPRFPDRGLLPVAVAVEDGAKHSYMSETPENRRTFRFRPGDLRKDWKNLRDVEVVVHQDWTEARLRVDRIDEAQYLVSFTGSSWRPLGWSTGFAGQAF